MDRFPIGRFLTDQGGNYSILMAVVLVPLLMATGLAVDTSAIASRQNALQQAVDSAVLAIAREGDDISDERAREIAGRFLNVNLDPRYTDLRIVRDRSRVTLDARSRTSLAFGGLVGYDTWDVAATSSADIAFTKYEIALVLDTTGSMKGGKLASMKDAVLGLVDTMSDQIGDPENLKFAVVPFSNFVNVGAQFGPDFTNGGKVRNKTGADWLDLKGDADFPQLELVKKLSRFELFHHLKQEWKGCVETRYSAKFSHDIEDTEPDAKDPSSLFVPAFSIDEPNEWGYSNNYINPLIEVDPLDTSLVAMTKKLLKYGIEDLLAPLGGLLGWTAPKTDFSGGKGPNKDCVTQPIMALGNDYQAIRNKVNSLQANGNTNIMEGVAWGMRTLSPQAPFTEGSDFREPGIDKIMIVLTDGANVFGNKNNRLGSNYSSHGYLVDGRLGITTGSASDTNALMNAKTLGACDYAKKEGVIVYTIRLEEPDVKTGMMLKDCASSPDHFFDAPSRAQLDDVFKAIRERVVRLRISS